MCDPATVAIDPSLADAELRLAMLKRLASLGMRVAEEIAERMVNSPYHPEPRHEPGQALNAVARSVRLTVELQRKVMAEVVALRNGEVPPLDPVAAPRMGMGAPLRDAEYAAPDRADAEPRERNYERLVDREDDETLADRPFEDQVETIRAGLETSGILLPLREKVAAKPTDEGSTGPIRTPAAAYTKKDVDPSSDPLRGPPSPARGEGSLVSTHSRDGPFSAP